MALRDQPYLPLYIQDFLTDEKLIECSASATGVYIRLMCIMHKSDEYGKILLKQKDKQTPSNIENFALKVSRQMPYHYDEIKSAIGELVEEEVIYIDGDYLVQRRMVKDNDISSKRSVSGKIGGNKRCFAQAKVQAKVQANSEYENENENRNEDKDRNENAIGMPKYLSDLWPDYLVTRKNKKAARTQSALKRILDKLEKLAPDNQNMQREILAQSIDSGWVDVFPLRQNSKTKFGRQEITNEEIEKMTGDFLGRHAND